MDTKRIGNIGEAKVLSKFVELGFPVYVPFGDNEKADLIAEFDGKLNKIQVKTTRSIVNGTIAFSLVSSTVHRKNGHKHKYSRDEVDYFACYCIENDSIYLIPVPEQPRSGIIIRVTESTKNNQKGGINQASDFLIDNVLCVETLHGTASENEVEEKVQTTKCENNVVK